MAVGVFVPVVLAAAKLKQEAHTCSSSVCFGHSSMGVAESRPTESVAAKNGDEWAGLLNRPRASGKTCGRNLYELTA